MSLPSSVTLIPVHGKILNPVTGDGAAGYIDFALPSPLVDEAHHFIVGRGRYRAELDAEGEFNIELPATDDPDLTPRPWLYEITVKTDVMATKFKEAVPVATVGTLEFTDMLP